MCLNYLYRCEKQGKTPQKDAKINLERRTKKVSETEKITGQKKTINKIPKIETTGQNIKNIN